MSPLSPLLLQAQIVPPAGGGSFGLADTTRLENPFQAPMWLDEIRFRLPSAGGEAGPGDGDGTAWSSLRVELKLGNTPLTNGFVPISLLGKGLNDTANGFLGEPQTGGPGIFTWKLPKPLFIPARELLRPTMYYDTYSGAPAKTVTILYACRPLPRGTPTPKKLNIPWVTYFQPPFNLHASRADLTHQSTPADIFNPWNEDLHVQRFVGRLMCQGGGGEANTNMQLASVIVNTSTGAETMGTLVSAQDSFNNILVRDRTPFTHLFDLVDRSWTVNCVLPPKGFYLFTVDRLWATDTGTVDATVGISMVGWREVNFQ